MASAPGPSSATPLLGTRSSPGRRLGIRSRLSIVFSALIVLLILLFGFLSLERFRAASRAELAQSERLLRENLIRKGMATVQTLALSLESALAENNYGFLYNVIATTTRADPDVAYGMIVDPAHKVLVSSNRGQQGQTLATAFDDRVLSVQQAAHFDVPGQPIIEVAAPVGSGADRLGTLRFGLSLRLLEVGLTAARERQRDELARAAPIYLGVTVGFVLIGLVAALLIARRITKPLARLTRQAEAIGEGDLELSVAAGGPDEVAILAATIDSMRVAVKREIADLRSLYDVGKTLAGSLVREEVAAAAIQALRARVGGGQATFYTLHEQAGGAVWRLAAGEGERELPAERLDRLPTAATIVRRGAPRGALPPDVAPGESSALVVPLTAGTHRLGVIGLHGAEPDQAGLQFADTIASSVAQSLENIRLLETTAEQARIDSELRTAQAVQRAFIPGAPPVVAGLEIAAAYLPATEVGGDWYGFYPGGDALHVLIGDVTGHGVPAALLTACAVTTCQMMATDAGMSPAGLVERLAGIISGVGKGELMMTFFAARVDGARREVVFANAGHNAPYHLHADGRLGVLATGPTWLLGSRERPRGPVREHRAALEPGDTLVFFTDGLIECESPLREPFGTPALHRLLREEARSATALRDRIMTAAMAHYGNRPRSDDITLVVLRVAA